MDGLLGLAFVAGFIAFFIGGFCGFLRAGKLIAARRTLTPGGTIGLVLGCIATGLAGLGAKGASIGMLALGALSDAAGTIEKVMPFVLSLTALSVILLFCSGWLLVSLVRRAHANHTQPAVRG